MAADAMTLNFTTQFEAEFDHEAFLAWLRIHWPRSVWYGALYVASVLIGQWFMKERPKYNLRRPLAIWSGILAIFSIAGMLRTAPELFYALHKHGARVAMCDNSYLYGSRSVWAYMFLMSKLYELGDTAFIVLRKQPLIFLHWYHHATVLAYTWYSVSERTGPGQIFMVMNYSVHSFMYTYYTVRALGYRPPKVVNMVITSLQIVQMIVGMCVGVWVYSVKSSGGQCQQEWTDVYACIAMYASYLILFSSFFYNTYISPKKLMKTNKVD